ncbi:Bug family tripartite tricarboxylate transporter substrate binding protein [Hydrogenophaga laconesensis]|uniref:Tripartite-type tricarboxylate transporter receptor subunit TctC n=1 Tax=Hydrogenophaga laconesensis TaxID=1805971 RepID=A0ABU1VBD2_9BURK|nr:tripartite tricarboxylate transporter substrate binding protein [Hydrogenophaga laconesensis]MDR7094752.1 tripartite-type tricarboxylate transporter receptor subunit TctC [Hydrogenophaga laconesensis]
MRNASLPVTRRRTVVAGALALAASLPLSALAQSGAYPNRPIQVVVPFPAGGIVDNVTRKLNTELSATLGQPLVVENKAGAGGSIGATQVARSKADGYTLLTAFDTHAVNPLLYKLGFDSEKDLKPIALIATSPLVLVVHPSVPANSLRELVDLAKARPDTLHYASTGAGSSNHLTTELFKATSGASFNHVPYKGGAPAITDVLGGQVQVMFVSVTSVLAHIRAGKMRALAVTSRERIPALPDVPPVSDTYRDFEAHSWVGLLAPAGVPADVVSKLNGGVNAALKSPEFQKFLDEQSLKPAGGTPEQFDAFMKAETRKWGEVIKRQNIRVE